MSADPRGQFLYQLPPTVLWEFCRLMDGLSDRDWTRFASEVLSDQTAVRLAEKKEKRTDWVMNQWENRNGRVGELINLLERLQLLRPCDVILSGVSSLRLSSPPPPLPPPPKQSEALSTLSTLRLSPTGSTHSGGGGGGGAGAGRPLPRPAPPPSSLQSDLHCPPQALSSGVMRWPYEEVHAGTAGFSPSLQVGEGGFGVVYRASLRNTDCAVKRLKQDCLLDWTLLRESFQTEVDQLTRFRHPNIVDLLGFSEGGGSVCLIYSFMELRSLEDQLHQEAGSLSWCQRVGVVKEASAALQFLHCPPGGQTALIHGDVKSSNILLDRHLVAKMADFGLARFASRGSSGRSAAQTASVGKTATVRGTLAYLPEEYVRNRELGTAVDVYSFGVVLLEVLTGRRALEKDRKSRDRYLKELVDEVGPSAEAWREQLDCRLVAGGAAEPAGCMEVVELACRCLDRNKKKRPAMTEVFDRLKKIHIVLRKTNTTSSSSSSFPPPPCPLDSSVDLLSNHLSKLGPLEDTYQAPQSYQPSQSSQCSSSSFSSSSLTPPHPLHSSSSLPLSSFSSSFSSSFTSPCETDESRGFSQYNLDSQSRSNGTSSKSRSQDHSPGESQVRQPSVPTEDQYTFPPQPSEGLSPAGSLKAASSEPSVHMNPSKLRFLQKKNLYEEGRIQTPELLSSEDLYGEKHSVRGPEESDELDDPPAKHH